MEAHGPRMTRGRSRCGCTTSRWARSSRCASSHSTTLFSCRSMCSCWCSPSEATSTGSPRRPPTPRRVSTRFAIDTMTGLPVPEDQIQPKGQFGRVLAFAVRIAGILWFSSVVAAVKNSMRLSSDENQTLLWMKMAKVNSLVRTSAARCIQYMHLYGVYHWVTLRQVRRLRQRQQQLRAFMGGGTRLEESDFDIFMKTAKSRMSERKRLLEGVEKDIDQALEVDVRGRPKDVQISPREAAAAAKAKAAAAAKAERGESKIAPARQIRKPTAVEPPKDTAMSKLASTQQIPKVVRADKSSNEIQSNERTPETGSPQHLSRRASLSKMMKEPSRDNSSNVTPMASSGPRPALGAKSIAASQAPSQAVSGTATPVVQGSQKRINIYDPDGTGGTGEISIANSAGGSPSGGTPMVTSPRDGSAGISPNRAPPKRKGKVSIGFADDENVSGRGFGYAGGEYGSGRKAASKVESRPGNTSKVSKPPNGDGDVSSEGECVAGAGFGGAFG
ncbi:hypothetical protein T484DRAFT_1904744, partial [Baffinella frigidus]